MSLQKSKALKPKRRGPAMRSRLNRDSLVNAYSGKKIWQCVWELIKDARDWGATSIWIYYEPDQRQFVIIDNGSGMDAGNRECFISLGESSAAGLNQSGKYGTGSKYMFLGHSHRMEIWTAPQDTPHSVFSFSITVEEFTVKLNTDEPFFPQEYDKDEDSWPYLKSEFSAKTGTAIRYELCDPKDKGMPEPEQLGLELAYHLPEFLRRLVTFNGQPLPNKEIQGDFYVFETSQPGLGSVSLEFYRPAKMGRGRHHSLGDQGVILGGYELGEVDLEHFFTSLPSDMRERFPLLLLDHRINGTISWSVLRDYVNADRCTLNPAIQREKAAIFAFLRLLQTHLPRILDKLQIPREASGIPMITQDDTLAWAKRVTERYDPKGAGPPVGRRFDGPDDEDKDDSGGLEDKKTGPPSHPTERPALILRGIGSDQEVMLGEEFTLKVDIRENIKSQIDAKSVKWHFDRAAVRQKSSTDPLCATFEAKRVGQTQITVEVPQTPWRSVKPFDIVAVRQPRLSVTSARLKKGDTLTVQVLNYDLIKGEGKWTYDGPGTFTPRKSTLIFEATRRGQADIWFTDPAQPRARLQCTVSVEGEEPTPAMGIRGYWFDVVYAPTSEGDSSQKVCSIIDDIEGPNGIHTMIINSSAPGAVEAKQEGAWQVFLTSQAGLEFAAWCVKRGYDINPLDSDAGGVIRTIDMRDALELVKVCQRISGELIHEIHGVRKT